MIANDPAPRSNRGPSRHSSHFTSEPPRKGRPGRTAGTSADLGEKLPIDSAEDAEAVKSVVGPNITRIRSSRNMAVRQLAEQAGVSAAFISQIEHSVALPSVATLVRIAKALHTNIGDLFDAAHSSRMVIRKKDRSPYEYPERGITEAQISSDPSGSLEVLWIKYAVGAGTGAELFAHGASAEFVFVLKGEVSISVGAQTHVLAVGDSLTFPGSEVHGSQNSGRGPAEILWMQTPASY